MMIPESIRVLLGDRNYVPDQVGLSRAQVLCFDDMVLKIEEVNRESDNELAMLRWLEGRLPVPKILAEETVDGIHYLLMSRLPGAMACSPEYLAEPEMLVRLLAEGLRRLWSVDVTGCPGNQMLDTKLENARYQVENELYDLENVEPETFGEKGFDSPAHLLSWLKEHRPEEACALSHGDYCLPNVFFRESAFSGFLDLGRCGIADPYQDIALCYRSLRDNFNGSYGHRAQDFDPCCLFRELGIEPDWEKIRYYLLLDELF